jgi:2,4-dienoyl-CoA reductase-like NADH-dependent reductase (Old Yellow Enzyme family)/thioredoxin reductase
LHVGRRAPSKLTFAVPVAPSALPAIGMETPSELSIEEIKKIVKKYKESAKRALEANFDSIELHMAHGYLIHQFLSPYSNKRNDEYGATLEGRGKLSLEIIKEVRKVVGKDFPIIVKMSGDDFLDQGIDIEMSKKYIKLFENAGIDAVVISAGILETAEYISQPMAIERGVHVKRAREIKKNVDIPVVAIGRINKPYVAEEILNNGDADMVALGRALIADPYFPKKAKKMEEKSIRPCIACGQGCTDRLYNGVAISCLTNPTMGREEICKITQTQNPKKLLVVGGGPAGLTCASIAAKRGHDVTLIEKKDTLAGLFNYASLPPHKEEIKEFNKFMEYDAKNNGVNIITGKNASSADLQNINPDVVVMATGSLPFVPREICKGEFVTAEQCLANDVEVQSPCVVIGGGLVGCETAHFLAEKGLDVKVVEMMEDFAPEMGNRPRKLLLENIIKLGVDLINYAKVSFIGDDFIEIQRLGLTETITNVKSKILAIGYKSNKCEEIETECLKMNIPLYQIGDCIKPRKAIEAIHEGYDCAMKI